MGSYCLDRKNEMSLRMVRDTAHHASSGGHNTGFWGISCCSRTHFIFPVTIVLVYFLRYVLYSQ